MHCVNFNIYMKQSKCCQLRARRALSLLNDVLLRTRRALLLYKGYCNSVLLVFKEISLNSINALLVLNGTSLNSINALLVLNVTMLNSINALVVLNGTMLNSINALLVPSRLCWELSIFHGLKVSYN